MRCDHGARPRLQTGLRALFGRLQGDSLSRTYANFLIQGINASELKDTQVVVRVYRPVAHFTRKVEIPGIKLADWTAK
jgi:hypothetical protein